MYLDTWDEFQKAAEDIYVASPARVLDDFPLFSLFDTSVNTDYHLHLRQDTFHRIATSTVS
jgi:hypothetical protein